MSRRRVGGSAAAAPLRVGLIGAGQVTLFHCRAWANAPGASLVAVADPDLARARARAAEFGIPAAYADPAEMLARERLDAVDVASPVGTHAANVRLAAARGVHVLCQKPLCPTLAEAEALVAAVGDRVRFMVHENWRWRPPYRQAARWLAGGRVGTVLQCRLSVRSSSLVEPAGGSTPPQLLRQPFVAALPRFLVFEVLIHHLDVVRWLLGPLGVRGAVTQRVSRRVIGEDVATILLGGADGQAVVVEGSFHVPGAPPLPVDELDLYGTGGRVRFDGETLALEGDRAETVRFDPPAAYQASYDAVMAHFVAGLRTGAPFETDRLDNLETLRLVEAAYSAAAG
jgi:predicted dehydrogenase